MAGPDPFREEDAYRGGEYAIEAKSPPLPEWTPLEPDAWLRHCYGFSRGHANGPG
jgi:hypothetical protein